MEQMNINEAAKVAVDFDEEVLPKSAKVLQPLVWKEGDHYCCLLGPDQAQGVLGYGDTPLLAIVDWDTNLTARLAEHQEDDEVIQYVKDVYKMLNTEVW